MLSMMRLLYQGRKGLTTVEWALILTLVAIVCVVACQTLGTSPAE